MVRPRKSLLVNWLAYEFIRAQSCRSYFNFPMGRSYRGKEHLMKTSKSLSAFLTGWLRFSSFSLLTCSGECCFEIQPWT